MAKVIKNVGQKIWAYKLGNNSDMEIRMINEGKIAYIGNDMYKIFSKQSSDKSQTAKRGDFFKVDSFGYPYPTEHAYFLATHRRIDGDCYEQLPKSMDSWESTEAITAEVQFLIDHKGLKLSPEAPYRYFEVQGSRLTATANSVLIFTSIIRDENGIIIDADFTLVARKGFEAAYHYC